MSASDRNFLRDLGAELEREVDGWRGDGSREWDRIRFEIVDDIAHIDGSVGVGALDLASPDLELCRTVLQAIAETHQLELSQGRLVITASKPLDLAER